MNALNSKNSQRSQQHDQEKLCVSDAPHWSSPFKADFNALLDSMSTEVMKSLMTTQQRNLAQALWEAANFGGKPKPGEYKLMEPIKDYYKWVLLVEHSAQWANHFQKKSVNCIETTQTDD
jgi:hypothetical protein